MKRARTLRVARVGFLCAATLATQRHAHAGGLYFSDRGVRPLGRAGAFVAGADDLGAIAYNPAGVAFAGTSFLLDGGWLNHHASFTRSAQVVSAGGTVSVYDFPTVTSTTPFLPIPTLAASYAFGALEGDDAHAPFTASFGVYSPYTAITSFPLAQDGAPAPSRYSLVSLDGSLLSVAGAYLGYRPSSTLALGIGVTALLGTFQSTVVFNTNPADRLFGAPEDPTYDSLSELKAGPIFSPSGAAGAIWNPDPRVRIGVSGTLPTWVNTGSTVKARLPQAAPFDNAFQSGEDARVSFRLPAVARLGVEVRPARGLRVELAYAHEFWSLHDTIEITPKGVTLNGITGFPSPFPFGKITLPRNFEDSNSVHLGGEFHFKWQRYGIDARAGTSFEQSAIPTEYLSPLTIDMNKVTVAIGGGLHIAGHWRFDLSYAHVFALPVDVDPATAKIGKINPVKGNATRFEAVNGGHYSATADVLGAGLNYAF